MLSPSGCSDTVPNSTWERTHERGSQPGIIPWQVGTRAPQQSSCTPGPQQEASAVSPSLGVALALGRDSFLKDIPGRRSCWEFPLFGDRFKVRSGWPLPCQHSETQAPVPGEAPPTGDWYCLLGTRGHHGPDLEEGPAPCLHTEPPLSLVTLPWHFCLVSFHQSFWEGPAKCLIG